MKWAGLCGFCCGLWCATGLAQKDDAATLAQADRIGTQCVSQLASLKQAAASGEAGRKERYRQALGKLEAQLKTKGEVSKVIALRDELERAQGCANPLQAKATLPEARHVQQELLAAEHTSQLAAARKMVAATGDALKQLATLRKDVNPPHHDRIKKQADLIAKHAALKWVHEVAPELTLPRLADPPPDKPITTHAGKGEKYTFYPLGKEPAQRNARPLKLEIAFAELRAAQIDYSLVASEAEGLPRVSLTAKNSELPAKTRLVIEYFDKYPGPRGYRRESVEHIELPAIPRGSGLVVEGHGMREYGSKLVGIKSFRPLYGIVISLFDEHGKIFMQGCAPSALMQECRRELPDPL